VGFFSSPEKASNEEKKSLLRGLSSLKKVR
jgi:hypothetical protein